MPPVMTNPSTILRSALLLAVVLAPAAQAQTAQSGTPQPALRQTQADATTRYELLEPSSQSFRIVYDVTATTPGAKLYFNPIRPGSEPTVHGVTDRASGRPLPWKLVDGNEAIADGLAGASASGQYIRVELPRRVPGLQRAKGSTSPGRGEVRLRIDKTYADPASYRSDGDEIVFERSLGIRRNAVVLPQGFELLQCSVPAQIGLERDGRVRLSFMNRGPGPAELRVVGRRRPKVTSEPPQGGELQPGAAAQRRLPGARTDFELSDRAFQDREIVYFLQPPETHSFRLYHDYTESRPGVGRYLNVVRAGSSVSDPQAWNLDTGAALEVETLRGTEITKKGIDLGEPTTTDTEVVVIRFDAPNDGESVRLRIEETYTDAGRYGLHQGELLWDRSFGRPRNAVVLPQGWWLTLNAVPATVRETDDGRVRLDFENDRPGTIDVLIRARQR